MTKLKVVLDDLTDDEAWALAQPCRRMIYDDFKKLSALGLSTRTWFDPR
jgi:hypothetical protein